MVNGLLGQFGLTAAMRARVTAAAEGNPLFVEQLVSMLIDEGGTGRHPARPPRRRVSRPPSRRSSQPVSTGWATTNGR